MMANQQPRTMEDHLMKGNDKRTDTRTYGTDDVLVTLHLNEGQVHSCELTTQSAY